MPPPPTRRSPLVAGLLLVGLLAALVPSSGPAAAQERGTRAGARDAGLAMLADAMEAADRVPHDARLVVAEVADDGRPALREHVVVSRPGDVHALARLDVARLAETHRVRGAGRVSLATGAARVVRVGWPRAEDRERLFVDERTGLLVRREVFDGDGRPVRVAAYTELQVVAPDGPAVVRAATPMQAHPLAEDRLDILAETGWLVPEQLGAFTLDSGYAADQGPDGSVLHLRYDDGLYALSLYEQVGLLDRAALRDAVPVEVAGGTGWHWPGTSPSRLVLAGDGRTFTVVSEAPLEVVVAAVGELPNDRRPSVTQRMTRGARRVAAWAWPFG